MAKTTKAKETTLRQRMRADAEKELEELEVQMLATAVRTIGKKAIKPLDLMRLCCGGQTKTVKNQLITDLTNGREAALEALYSKQQGLPLGDDNV
jgi:hypothetical protein